MSPARISPLVVTLALLSATGLPACFPAPQGMGDRGVGCSETSDCRHLEEAYGVEFRCDAELKLCVTRAPAGDGGSTSCDPACTGVEVCEAGTCVVPGPTVVISSPAEGAGITDSIQVTAEVVPGPGGLDSVDCQAGDHGTVGASPGVGLEWTCDLIVGGLDGPLTVVVTAADGEGRSGRDQVTVIRDTLQPSIMATLRQIGVNGPLDQNSEVWPTGFEGHGPLEIEVVVNDRNFAPEDLVVEIPRGAALPAFTFRMDCVTDGITHTCQSSLDLRPADFTLDGTRGPQVLYATATDVAGNQAETTARFHVDDTPPDFQSSGCTGVEENDEGRALRDSVIDCIIEVTDDATDLAGPPTASVPSTAAAAISVTTTLWPEWKVSVNLQGNSFNAFEPTIDITVSAQDLWGNLATTVLQKGASRLRWQRNLGGALLSPALGPDGHIYVVSNNAPGDADLHSLGPADGATQRSRSLTLGGGEGVLAGPVVQQRASDGASFIHLLTSTGSIATLDDLTRDSFAIQRPAASAGYMVGFRSLPVISADGEWAYAVVRRSNQNFVEYQVGIEAIGASYSGGGTTCTAVLAIGNMDWASIAAYTVDVAGGQATVIYAADQVGNAIYGTCTGCDCTAYRDDPAPARWSGIAAYGGGFLYPAPTSNGTTDEVEWGDWDPIAGAGKPTWRTGRLTGKNLSGGPVHDTNQVVAGGSGPQTEIDLHTTSLVGLGTAMGSDYGDVTILDIVLGDNGTQWILHKPASAPLQLANVAVGTTANRWSGALGGVNVWPDRPTIDRPRMLLEYNYQSLYAPHGGAISSIIVDAQATAGWPMGRADPYRTACLP